VEVAELAPVFLGISASFVDWLLDPVVSGPGVPFFNRLAPAVVETIHTSYIYLKGKKI